MKIPDRKYWSKKTYLERKFKDFMLQVELYIKSNNLIDLNNSQQCYHYVNKLNQIPKCKQCSKNVKFLGAKNGYREYCSNKCSANSIIKKEKIIKTSLERYNETNPSKSKIVKEKRINTFKKNYGIDWVSKSDIIKQKVKNTLLKNYGVDNYFKSDSFKLQIKNKFDKLNIKSYNELKEVKEKKIITLLKNFNVTNPKYLSKRSKNSKIENKIKDKFNLIFFEIENKKFDLKYENKLYEIDGKAFHPKKFVDCSLTQINTSVNDFKKNKIAKENNYELIRIDAENLLENYDKILNINDIENYSYQPNYEITYEQKIISKEYFKNYIENNGKEKLEKYVPLLLNFIRIFQLDFPYNTTKETLDKIITKINKNDLSQIYDIETKTFSNISNSYGVQYLKSIFKNYWHSKYKNNKSPFDAFYDDKILHEVIKYRIGCNNSNEVFDFSLKEIVKGLSARRTTISFFKPLIASAIYKHFLQDKINPTVIDPCAGFGGRLLGFKAIYPKGKYIGIEPNIETFNYLKELAKDFENVELYNFKAEDYKGSFDCDLTFTSIPYYDLEEYYGLNLKYESFSDWENKFIVSGIMKFKNKLINLPQELYDKLNINKENHEIFYLKNHTSHLAKNKIKKELIIRIK